jgi:hypothetical protein
VALPIADGRYAILDFEQIILMPTSRRCIVILSYLVAASFIYGCAFGPVNTSQTYNFNAPLSNPGKPESLDRQLLEVAGASAFKEEPDDPAAALSLIDAGPTSTLETAPASPS